MSINEPLIFYKSLALAQTSKGVIYENSKNKNLWEFGTHEQVYVYTTLKNMIANHPLLFYKNQ